jgi:hypothetical protein
MTAPISIGEAAEGYLAALVFGDSRSLVQVLDANAVIENPHADCVTEACPVQHRPAPEALFPVTPRLTFRSGVQKRIDYTGYVRRYLGQSAMRNYRKFIAETSEVGPLNFAHARSGDAMMIHGDIGDEETFDDIMVEFAERYADRTEGPHAVTRGDRSRSRHLSPWREDAEMGRRRISTCLWS